MAQAAPITTAILQLMSRGRSPNSTSPARQAHSELVAALAVNVPHAIHAGSSADDLDGRAKHLEKVFGALHAHLAVVIGDTAENLPGRALDRHYFGHLFQDLSADAVGVIQNAARKCAMTRIGGRRDPSD